MRRETVDAVIGGALGAIVVTGLFLYVRGPHKPSGSLAAAHAYSCAQPYTWTHGQFRYYSSDTVGVPSPVVQAREDALKALGGCRR